MKRFLTLALLSLAAFTPTQVNACWLFRGFCQPRTGQQSCAPCNAQPVRYSTACQFPQGPQPVIATNPGVPGIVYPTIIQNCPNGRCPNPVVIYPGR